MKRIELHHVEAVRFVSRGRAYEFLPVLNRGDFDTEAEFQLWQARQESKATQGRMEARPDA